MDSFIQKERRKANASILSWLLCLVPSLIGIAVWLSLQQAVEMILAAGGISTWSWDAIQTITFLTFGLLWLAAVFFMQHKLFKSAVSGMIWNRFVLINLILLVLLLSSQVIRFLVGTAPLTAGVLLPLAGEALLCLILLFFYRQSRRQ
jgi:hypothetical protein